MATYWTVLVGTTEKSFEDWGITGSQLKFRNQATDSFSFAIPDDVTATESFTYNQVVSVYKARVFDVATDTWSGGSRVFMGKIRTIPKIGTGSAQMHQYVALGPWDDLEQTMYQQPWKGVTLQGGVPTTLNMTHIFLGWYYNGSTLVRLTTKQVAADHTASALSWAISCGASIALGAWEPSTTFSYKEVVDQTCAEVIRSMLRYHPDAVTWVDYTASTPTLNATSRASLPAVTIPYGAKPLSEVELVCRSDIAVPCVCLKYERTDTTDDNNYVWALEDKWPTSATGKEIGALVNTINLYGSSTTTVSCKYKTRTISPMSVSWWKNHLSWMNDTKVSSTYVLGSYSVVGFDEFDYPTELVDGSIASWTNVGVKRGVVYASFDIQSRDENNNYTNQRRVEAVNVIATTANDSADAWVTASAVGSYTEGETPPGWNETTQSWTDAQRLSYILYTALNSPHYEGRVVLVEDDAYDWLQSQSITNKAGVGLSINISSGRTEWATMIACVQEVDIDIGSGRTSFTVGPPQHLGAQDIIEWSRENRNRHIWQSYSMMGTGVAGGSSSPVTLAEYAAAAESGGGAPSHSKFNVAYGNDYLQLDTTASGNNPELKLYKSGYTAGSGTPGIVAKITATDHSLTFNSGDANQVKIKSGSTLEGEETGDARARIILGKSGDDNLIDICTTDAESKVIKLRKMKYCNELGELQDIIVLCSEPYTGA